MANPFKTFFEALLGKNHENDKEIEHAEKLGEIVANNAEISIGIRNKVHVNAEAARKAAEAKEKNKPSEEKGR
ncbi:MAG: hypothetical protein J6A29_00885 [Clostridia bacterium]|nr:hypothetical protein [Clostridia bacterium]